jgi:hypothetical protein
VLVLNLKKKFGKCLTMHSYYVIEKSKFWSKNGFALMTSNPAMLYTAGKSVQSYVDWYQNYENRLTGSKVMAFFSTQIRKKVFQLFLYILAFLL